MEIAEGSAAGTVQENVIEGVEPTRPRTVASHWLWVWQDTGGVTTAEIAPQVEPEFP